MKYNKKSLKKIGKKFIIVGSIIGFLLNPMNSQKVNAYDYESQGYYEYDEDNLIYNACNIDNLDFLNNTQYSDIIISNSDIKKPINITNDNICSLKFVNCNLNNITFPDSLLSLELDSTKLENYDSIKNSKIENLSFTSYTLDNLKMLPNTLCQIGIYNCKLPTLSGIENCTNISNLIIENSNTSSISELKYLNKLDSLILRDTFIKDLSPIKYSNLSVLDISNSTRINNLDVVLNIKSLHNLYATNCEMAYTKELVNYINTNNIQSNINEEGLACKNKVEEISRKILSDKQTNQEKISAIVNYVIDNIEYDDRFYEDEDYAYELNENGLKYALLGKGCCKNYTSLTSALLKCANIDYYDIKNEVHIWNLINLDGEFYWIDTTYLDEENKNIENSKNYMTQSEEFEEEHFASNVPDSNYDYNKIDNNIIKLNNENQTEKNITKENDKKYVINLLKEKNIDTKIMIGILCSFGIIIPAYIKIRKKDNIKIKNKK